jgi:putative transposase
MSSRGVLPVQDFYTAVELAGLDGMPGTRRGVSLKAGNEGWGSRKRQGRGGGLQYAFASLPQVTRDALLARAFTSSGTGADLLAPEPEKAERKLARYEELNDDQMSVMTARVAFVREVQRLSQVTSQQKAIDTLVKAAREKTLTPYLAERAVRANDRKTDTRTLSVRTLKRWFADFKKHGERALAPARRKADMNVPSWGPAFLARYQRPQKPSIAAAFEQLREQTEPPHPSIDQVRRWLKKLTPEAREKGRRSPQELKALQPFKRRSTDHMWPNDVWVSDGHTFDAEVMNPLTGQAFRPEITVVLDWYTRRIVGFALNLAESTVATLDALRHGITNAGMFSLFYVDNGSGFKNAAVYEVVDRLGGTITHALPYNSQGRGIIERPHRTTLVRLAKEFDSYIGADMDKQAATRAHRLSRKAIKAGLKPVNIPSFQEFYERLTAAVEKYNHTPHSGLRKIRDLNTLRFRHQSPMEIWASAEVEGFEAITAEADLVASLTRPQEVRKTNRGEVRINSEIYFLDSLRDFHGEEIKVAWDYRNASSVGVFTLEGELIGEAELHGNSTEAQPQTVLQRAGDKRVKGQIKLLATKAKTVTGKDVEIRVIEPEENTDDLQRQLAAGRAKAKQLAACQPETFVIPEDPMARYRLWKKLEKRATEGDVLSKKEQEWLESFPATADHRAIKRVMDASADGKTVSARRAM